MRRAPRAASRREAEPVRTDPCTSRDKPLRARSWIGKGCVGPAPCLHGQAHDRHEAAPYHRACAQCHRWPAPHRRGSAPHRRRSASCHRASARYRRRSASYRHGAAPCGRGRAPYRRTVSPCRAAPAPLHRAAAPHPRGAAPSHGAGAPSHRPDARWCPGHSHAGAAAARCRHAIPRFFRASHPINRRAVRSTSSGARLCDRATWRATSTW